MHNYYKLLAIKPTADAAEVKEAVKKAIRLWSNRTNAPQLDRRQEAERMVKAIEEGEALLLDSAKRAEYDRKLKSTPPPLEEAADKRTLDAADDLVAEGRRLLAEGSIPDALYAATKATERDGANAEAWALLGEARFRFGDVEDAIYEYKRAIKLKPNGARYYSELGDIYDATDRVDEALTQYKRAVQADGSDPWYRAQIGYLLRKQGQTSDAVEILEQCVKERPNDEVFQFELAAAYVDSGVNCLTLDSESGKYFPTSKQQILASLEFIRKAEKLNCTNPDLVQQITANKEGLRDSVKRKFDGNVPAAVVGGLIWSCVYGLGLICLPLYFYTSRPPKYAMYGRLMGGKAKGSDKAMQAAARLADATGASENVRGGIGLAVIIGTGLFLPIMTVWNYVKNYTGENDTKNIVI